MKYQVEVTWRTVHVQTSVIEVEAEDKFDAADIAYDIATESDLDWSKEEIVDGDYVCRVVGDEVE